METPALKDKEITPTDAVLADTLGASYAAFTQWRTQLAEQGLELQWNYYSDGNAWLCKTMAGKKNIGWLIPYSGYFRTTFYFMARHADVLAASEIPEALKAEFAEKDFSAAKLHPLSAAITHTEHLSSARALLQLKQMLK